MPSLGLQLPELTEEDPQIEGEGTLDPVGLAPIADRLADALVPGVRSRMRRVRFVTASAVGARAAADLQDSPFASDSPPPSICFEWMMLEAFARKAEAGCLKESGVPGSAKVRSVIAVENHRLNERNYLKSPGVFGFTGVYLPLSRDLQVLDDARRPGYRLDDLTEAWERDQDLVGFTDGSATTPGASLRQQIHSGVADSMQARHCAVKLRSPLWLKLCTSLHPTNAGPREKELLRRWLMAEEQPIRAELARRVTQVAAGTESEVVPALLAGGPSAELELRLRAIVDFEQFGRRLLSVLDRLRAISTERSFSYLSGDDVANDSVLVTCAREIPKALEVAQTTLERLDPAISTRFTGLFEQFERQMPVPQLVNAVLRHHEVIQGRKPPGGKRPWFEAQGNRWAVRTIYRFETRTEKPVDPHSGQFIHPYRLGALDQFMADLAP